MLDCEHHFYFSDHCGADICRKCGLHAHVDRKTGRVVQELARCYCGWNLTPGERLEDDVEE